jgi:hypothetical protein
MPPGEACVEKSELFLVDESFRLLLVCELVDRVSISIRSSINENP